MANHQNKQQNQPSANQPSNAGQSSSGQTDTMVRNEPAAPATKVDEVSALREQVAQLTSMVASMLARESGAAAVAVPAERFNGDLNVQDIRRAMYDDERERKLTQRRLQAERSQQRALEHVASLRNSELELQSGPRKFEVAIPGEPRSMRLVGAINQHDAVGKYMENFGITTIADPKKRLSPRELSESEIPAVAQQVLKLVKVLAA